MSYLGMRAVGSTVVIFVTTHAQTGAAVAPSTAFEVGDFILYKNGSATQRTSTSGWAITSPFDSIVGLHVLTIDLSDNTDAGFYAAGSYYNLVLSPDETVDGLAVVREVASWDIGVQPANVTQLLGTAWLAPAVAGTPDVNAKQFGGQVVSAAAGVTVPSSIASPTNITAGTITTVTTLTNDPTGVTTLLSRIPSGIFTGITSLAQWLGLIAGKQTGNSTARTEVRATGAGSGTFDETTDSVEAIRDRGDAAWADSGTPPTAAAIATQVRTELTVELARVDAAVTTRATPAQVNTEVLDVMGVDTHAEPGQEAPGATITWGKKIDYLYKFLRNKITQSATEQKIFADDGTTVDHKATLSDDSVVFTKGEISSGP